MKILVVDDDLAQARSLARLIALSSQESRVSTADRAEQAIELLRDSSFDIVLTDLQMPELSGLELVQWLAQHQPHVIVFAMTAYPDDAALTQLEENGAIECLTKPVEVPTLLAKFKVALEGGMGGLIKNISLPSLLQIVELEKKTCTFLLSSPAREGRLYFREGKLIAARTEDLTGNEAAIELVRMDRPRVRIIGNCATFEANVTHPVGFIIMESMRLLDETPAGESVANPQKAPAAQGFDPFASSLPPAAPSSAAPASFAPAAPVAPAATVAAVAPVAAVPASPTLSESAIGSDTKIEILAPTPEHSEPSHEIPPHSVHPPRPSLTSFPDAPNSDAYVMAIISRKTGRVLFKTAEHEQLEALAQVVQAALTQEDALAARLGDTSGVQEFVLTTTGVSVLCRPLDKPHESLAISLFSPNRSTIAMERLALANLCNTLVKWVELNS